MGYAYAVSLKIISVCLISRQNFSIFARKGEHYPHIHNGHPSATWYNSKESHSGQFYLLYRTALFVCPESDTFLKNYSMYPAGEVRLFLQLYWHAGLCRFATVHPRDIILAAKSWDGLLSWL